MLSQSRGSLGNHEAQLTVDFIKIMSNILECYTDADHRGDSGKESSISGVHYLYQVHIKTG